MHNNEFYSPGWSKEVRFDNFSDEPQPTKAIRHLH